MADTSIYIKGAAGELVPVDTREAPNGDKRQVFLLGDGENAGLVAPATEPTVAAILAALDTKLAEGGTVVLDAASLAALESITATLSGAITVGTMPEVEVKNDAGNPLTTTPTGAGDVAATLTDGRKTVTTPGTAVAVRATLACKWVQVVALKTNTQQVNVGGSGALATAGASTGTPLDPGQSTTIPVNDAAKIFVDARVAGEGVSFTVGS